jgi:hypothetical protein
VDGRVVSNDVVGTAPCRRFAECKRSLNGVEKGVISAKLQIPFSPTVPPFATRSARVDGDVEASGGESGNVYRQGKAMANYP